MLNKMVSLILVGLLLNLTFVTSVNADNLEKEQKFAEKVKKQIAKIGTGVKKKIKVKLKDGSEIKGFVSQISDSDFTVVHSDNNSTTKILYTQVQQLKGNKNSKVAKIAGVVTVFFLLSIGFILSDSGV